jgi:hypothetical protein
MERGSGMGLGFWVIIVTDDLGLIVRLPSPAELGNHIVDLKIAGNARLSRHRREVCGGWSVFNAVDFSTVAYKGYAVQLVGSTGQVLLALINDDSLKVI